MKKALKGEDYYIAAREKIYGQLAQLPKGTIKKRKIYGNTYFYLQNREGKKVIHKYIGKQLPEELKRQTQQREVLKRKLADIQGILIVPCLLNKGCIL